MPVPIGKFQDILSGEARMLSSGAISDIPLEKLAINNGEHFIYSATLYNDGYKGGDGVSVY